MIAGVVVTCVYAWIVISQSGIFRIISTVAFLTAVVWGAVRLSREKSILRNLGVSVGAVIEQRKAPNSDGGSDYEAKYQFSAVDGKVYVGNSGGTIKELPEEGAPILVFYNKENPTRNMPRELFWFYGF